MASVSSPVSAGFADSSRWIIRDGGVFYTAQNRSYKEVLLGGTPIEAFFSENGPEIQIAPPERPKIRFTWPRRRRQFCSCEGCNAPPPVEYEFIDMDEQVICSGDWVYMDRAALMELPWIKACHADATVELSFNDLWRLGGGSAITNVTPDGGIWFADAYEPVYISTRRSRPNCFRTVYLPLTEDGWIDTNGNAFSRNIESVTTVQPYGDKVVYTYDGRGKVLVDTSRADDDDDYYGGDWSPVSPWGGMGYF